ncbi:MAG: ATP-binding protein [Patescibacteria group bacterium]
MFHSTRIKLTLWYVVIATVITAFFSLLIYSAFTAEIEHGLKQQRVIIENGLTPLGREYKRIYRDQPNTALIKEIHERFLHRMLLTDLIIVTIAAVAGYFLAGRTLRPLKQMVDEQNRFISDASHELRTPLTAARIELEVGLRDEKMNLPQAKELLQSNLEEIKNIQILSDNLLTLAQYKNGTQTATQQVSLAKIMEEATKRVKGLVKAKGIVIELPKTKRQVKGDEDRLIELFVILFDNAIKYSEKKKTITVTEEKTDGHIIVEVVDQGKGIATDDLPYIFDRFYRAEKSRNKTTAKGYGLGLSIAKQIVEEHEGKIEVKSEVGKGSRFSIRLNKGYHEKA